MDTPAKQAAAWKNLDANRAKQDFYDNQSPYDYYRNQGFSDAQETKYANADVQLGQPWRPPDYSESAPNTAGSLSR